MDEDVVSETPARGGMAEPKSVDPQISRYTMSWGRAFVIVALPYAAYTALQVADRWERHRSQSVGAIIGTAIFIPIAMVVTRMFYAWYGTIVYARQRR
uniref:Uncharacterized protein n=1 Tax=mine drainage metagenome TaxID=410659 RepID=E6Q274_9ZZZZ